VTSNPRRPEEKPNVTGMDYGPYGDMRPDNVKDDRRANRCEPEADVVNRKNVSTVKPEDYPATDRAISQPK
jgi:hypothetical protein